MQEIVDKLIEGMSIDEAFSIILEKYIDEGFGAILHNYYGGNAVGVSSFRSWTDEDIDRYLKDYTEEQVARIFGSDVANKLANFRLKNKG